MRIATTFVVLLGTAASRPAHADDPPSALSAPYTDVAPHVENESVRVAALGVPDERIARASARRASARRAAERRAKAFLHRWADESLARIHASPAIAADVHRAIDEHTERHRTRPLADDSAVLEFQIPLDSLRQAANDSRLPWHG